MIPTWSPETGTTYQTYTGPVLPGPPPPPPPLPKSHVNHNFKRLKWSVLDPPSEVEIFFLDLEDQSQWAPLFTDPIADEAATNPPRSQLQIRLQPLDSWEHWRQAEKEPPKPLLIENTDGQPISVKQFIQAVHSYAVPLRKLLCRCCDIYAPQAEAHARFYFTCTMGLIESTPGDPCTGLQVQVIEDTDEDGHQLAFHLETVEILYRKQLASK